MELNSIKTLMSTTRARRGGSKIPEFATANEDILDTATQLLTCAVGFNEFNTVVGI